MDVKRDKPLNKALSIQLSAPILLAKLHKARNDFAADPSDENAEALRKLTPFDPLTPQTGHCASKAQAGALDRRNAIARERIAPVVCTVIERVLSYCGRRRVSWNTWRSRTTGRSTCRESLPLWPAG